MSLTTCFACKGRRTYAETVPEVRYGVSHPDGWDGKPVRVLYETGRMVERLHTCPQCGGTGRVDLDAIRDRALIAAIRDTHRAGRA